jgi:hypothetical protein
MTERYEYILEENANLKKALASSKSIIERTTSKNKKSIKIIKKKQKKNN